MISATHTVDQLIPIEPQWEDDGEKEKRIEEKKGKDERDDKEQKES